MPHVSGVLHVSAARVFVLKDKALARRASALGTGGGPDRSTVIPTIRVPFWARVINGLARRSECRPSAVRHNKTQKINLTGNESRRASAGVVSDPSEEAVTGPATTPVRSVLREKFACSPQRVDAQGSHSIFRVYAPAVAPLSGDRLSLFAARP